MKECSLILILKRKPKNLVRKTVFILYAIGAYDIVKKQINNFIYITAVTSYI